MLELEEIDDFQGEIFEAAAELGDGDDGVDAGVLDDVGDFAIAEEVIDGDDALARQECSVETGRETGGGGEEDADVRFLGLAGEVHAEAGGHGGDLLVVVLAEVVGHGQILRVVAGVSEEGFEEHEGHL